MKTSYSSRKKLYPFMVMAGLAILLLAGLASADVVSQQLESISGSMSAPEDVAVSPDGKVYAVDAGSGRVLVFNANNQQVNSLNIDLPVAVAVGTGGYKYVATNKNFHVKILNSADQVINYLGNGYNEFVLPRNMAVDGTNGKVYVVDQLDNSIKVYTAAGSFVKRISDPNNQPIDATIWGNSLYVLDQPLVTDSNNGKIRGARVAVFDKTSGAYLRSFGTLGPAVGQLAKPRGITADSQGLLYITDSFHGVVQCFDGNGTYLGVIQNSRAGESMATPQGLAITAAGKLYVATSDSHDPPGLKIFGVNRPLAAGSDILVSPTSIAFGSVNIGSSSSTRPVTVTSNGSDNLVLGQVSLAGAGVGSFSIMTDGCSGRSLAGLSSCTVEILTTPASEGEKLASLAIPSNDSDTPVYSLGLSVTGVGAPVITASPTTVDFGFGAIGEVSAARTLTIRNTGNASLAIAGITTGGVNGNEFSVASDGCGGRQVAPAGTCTIGLRFAPVAEGGRSASLTIQSNDPARPNLAIAMSGQGYGYQDIRVSPLALDFGVIPKGTVSANRTVTIANQGTIGLYIGRLVVQGTGAADFLISPNACSERVLPAGGTCNVSLAFYPAVGEGGKAAKLLIPSNDPEQSEILVTLKGVASITPVGGVDPKGDPKSRGRSISVYIELPTGFSVNEIDTGTVVVDRINGVTVEPPFTPTGSVEIGDYNRNGIADLMVKFSRQELMSVLNPGESNITVSGELYDGTVFEQSSTISISNGN